MMKKSQLIAASLAVLSFVSAATGATEEEFIKSVNQNVGSTVDVSKAVPYLLVILAIIILLVLYSHYQKRQVYPSVVNHSGKLTRELCKTIHLRSVELKQLKVLADEQEVEHPLTLILCPSILGKAMRTPGARVDRAVLKQIVARLRQSLGG